MSESDRSRDAVSGFRRGPRRAAAPRRQRRDAARSQARPPERGSWRRDRRCRCASWSAIAALARRPTATAARLRSEVAQRLTGVEATTQATGKAQTDLATDLRDAQAQITLLETRLAESQAQQAALEALYRDLAPSRDEIALSEIEQVLLVASQQLQLAGNVPSALTALQLADAKLQRLDRPQFVPLRRALARDMDRLKAVPYVDVDGPRRSSSTRRSPPSATLPLAMDERLPAPARQTQRRPPTSRRGGGSCASCGAT